MAFWNSGRNASQCQSLRSEESNYSTSGREDSVAHQDPAQQSGYTMTLDTLTPKGDAEAHTEPSIKGTNSQDSTGVQKGRSSPTSTHFESQESEEWPLRYALKDHNDEHDECHQVSSSQPLKPRSTAYKAAGWEYLIQKTPVTDEGSPRTTDYTFVAGPASSARQSWRHSFGIMLLIVATYSTVMSGLWLVVSIKRPSWNHLISLHGGMNPDDASIISTLLAKSIELTFATTFIAYLGQKLSQRAYASNSPGVSTAQMSLKTWVMQPGTMVTNWESVRCAGCSMLGVLTIFAACSTILYVSASDAIVRPQNLLGDWQQIAMQGAVVNSFANINAVTGRCQTPISPRMDSDSNETCTNIDQAGGAYHNYMQYMSEWSNTTVHQKQSSDLRQRPSVPAILYENTTVTGSWIYIQDMAKVSNGHNRIINNVTLAFPHAGIVAASQDPRNRILQPSDLGDGMGAFNLSAAVPSPALNVLCTNVSGQELEPLIYDTWPNANLSDRTFPGWPRDYHDIPSYLHWHNTTVVDSIFEFGKGFSRTPPIFAKKPKHFNTIVNHTGPFTDSIYILAAEADSSYALCSLRASLVANCSTHYRATMKGGELTSHCEDPADAQTYAKAKFSAPAIVPQPDWSAVGTELALATALNDGLFNGTASNARLLTQLVPKSTSLDPSMPSIAEALAALAGNTLLASALGAPFVHEWDYPTTILSTPQYQTFSATVQARGYRSSYTKDWQRGFYVILFGTFAINCYCWYYLIIKTMIKKREFFVDFMEPQNLFSLAMNSRPDKDTVASYGGKPSREQYTRKWSIKEDHDRHVYFESADQPTKDQDIDMDTSYHGAEGYLRAPQRSPANTPDPNEPREFV